MGQADPPVASSVNASMRVVAICASAGGFVAIREVLAGLPSDFPGAIVIVQHLAPTHPSVMAGLLNNRCSLEVIEAREGDPVCPSRVLLAAPDHHLLANGDGTVSLTKTPMVDFHRPSGDLLFSSVAASYRERAAAVVLSGTGHDGADGVRAVKECGGTVIVQEEASSEFAGMPHAAILTGCADHVVPLAEIAPTVIAWVTGALT